MTRMHIWTAAILPAAFLLSACGSETREPAAGQASNGAANESAPAAPAAAVPSLAGAWTITQINGKAPDQVWPMIAEVRGGRFTLVSECRRMAWSFRQNRNVVQLAPDAGASVDCARVRSPAEQAVEKPIELANIAMFSDEGRTVELSGPGGRVTMTRR